MRPDAYARAEELRQELVRVLSRDGYGYDPVILGPELVANESATKRLADYRGEPYTTVLARYQRSCEPTPEMVSRGCRLWITQRLLAEGYSGTAAAYALCWSSPQALGRHIRHFTGRSVAAFGALSREEAWQRYVAPVVSRPDWWSRRGVA